MTLIAVCIPTLSGRGQYLANAVRGYDKYTLAPWNLSLVTDAPSAGVGWNQCAEQALEWWPETTHLHFSNDDVVPMRGWLPPLLAVTADNCLGAPRMEPSEAHYDGQHFDTHPPMPRDYGDDPIPRDKNAYYYCDLPENQPQNDWTEVDHGNLPFMSVQQWKQVGPFPPIHYGTDMFISHRARGLGMPTVARIASVFCNYNANIGRHKVIDGVEWTEQDFLDYDGVFAMPRYKDGSLPVTEPPPGRGTLDMREEVRAWRQKHLQMQREGH